LVRIQTSNKAAVGINLAMYLLRAIYVGKKRKRKKQEKTDVDCQRAPPQTKAFNPRKAKKNGPLGVTARARIMVVFWKSDMRG